MSEREVEFRVRGDCYAIRTELSDEDVGEVMDLVRRRVDEVSSSGSSFLSREEAVLATLNIAAEYVRLRREFATYRRKMNAYLAGLSKRIEESL